MRTFRLFAAAALGAFALMAPAPALAEEPSARPSADASPSPSVAASPSPSTSPSTGPGTRSSEHWVTVQAWFEPSTGYQFETVTLVVHVTRDDGQDAGDVTVGMSTGVLEFQDSTPHCAASSDPNRVICDYPEGTVDATYRITMHVGELEQWPLSYTLPVSVEIGVGELSDSTTATVTLDVRDTSPSPSPSPSASSSPSVAPSAAPSQSGTAAGGGLPVTGTPLALIAASGAALLAGGGVLLVLARRRVRSARL